MAARVRAHDWAATPLGPADQWRPELKMAAMIVLESGFPAALVWGDHLVTLYNDAYVPVLGGKPDALGASFADIWREAWHRIGPIARLALAGEAAFAEDLPLVLDRGRGPERAWFTFSCSPVRDAAGGVLGFIDTVVETTARQVPAAAREAARQKHRGTNGPPPDVLNAMVEGFALLGPDFAILDVNDRTAGLGGRSASQLVGRSHWDAFPGTEHSALGDLYRRVMRDRVPGSLEHRCARPDGREMWLEACAYPAPDGGLAVFWHDVTAAKRADEALRASQERQAFLLTLSDALRAEPDADGIATRALRMLSGQMRLDRCHVASCCPAGDRADVIHQMGNDRVAPLPRQLRLSGFPQTVEQMRTRTVVVENDAERPGLSPAERRNGRQLGMRAFVAPRLRPGANGRLWSMAAVSATPRRWTRDEIALVEEVAERTWDAMERALAEAALRERESQFRSLFDAIDEAVLVTEPVPPRPDGLRDWRLVAMNRRAQSMFGRSDLTGQSVRDSFPDQDEGWYDICEQVFRTGAEARFEREAVSLGKVLEMFVTRVETASGAHNLMVVMQDVTERRRITDALRRNEERQVFLLKLSDTLRHLTDPDEITGAAMRLLGQAVAASRAYYVGWPPGADHGEVASDFAVPGLHSLAGRYPKDAFRSAYDRISQGRTWIVEDAASDAELAAAERQYYLDNGVAAWIDVPLVKQGQLIAALCLVQAQARRWTTGEIALAEEVAERIWAAIERGRAETALRASEERFREFGDNSSDALWIVDAETLRLEYLSPAFETIWGESRAAAMADLSRWSDLIHPDDRETALRAMPRLLAGQSFAAEYRIRRPDGEVRWIRDAGFPIMENGAVKRGGGIAQDVTDLKRIEAALRDSEARLRRFGEASQDVLWIRDAETLQWQYLTPAFEQVYGLDRRKALAGDNYRNWLDLIVPEDRAHAAENIRRVRDGAQTAFEYRIRRPADGAIRWLRNTDFPIPNEAGNVTLIGGIGHDLTELRETELRLHALIEGIPQLVWRAGAPGRWSWASPQWTAYTGQHEADSRNWGWLEPLHPDDRGAARAAWDQAVGQGRLDVECRIRSHRDGAYRWFQTRAVPVRDEAGDIAEWVGTSTDIDELRDLQARQGVMVAELQHRTRNLITVISAISRQTIDEAASLNDFRHRFDDRLAALSRVQGLLSHLSAGQRVTFDQLLGSELSALGAPEGKVTLDGPRGVTLRSATVQTFALALHELATNALKHGALACPDGHLAIRWTVARGEDGQHRLRVDWRETGVPMPAAGNRPQEGGYGRVLIERALPYQLKAATTYDPTPDGVHCTIDVPTSAPARDRMGP